MITSSQQQQQATIMQQPAPFTRNGMPSLSAHHNPLISANNQMNNSGNLGNAELTGDSLWDSLYNTTIRTLSLDGLELLAKSFDNLDPNHQLYAGIAKRQRKLMEYQSEFRRNLEVFCQRANLNPKVWPSCIRHVKPSPREGGSSSANTSGVDLLGWPSSAKKEPQQPGSDQQQQQQQQQTPGANQAQNEPSSMPAPLTPLPQPQLLSPNAATTSTPNEQQTLVAVSGDQQVTTTTDGVAVPPTTGSGDSWSPKQVNEEQQQEQQQETTSKQEKEQDLLSTEMASSSIAEDKEEQPAVNDNASN